MKKMNYEEPKVQVANVEPSMDIMAAFTGGSVKLDDDFGV